jgi:hypothetical protein
MWTMMDDGSSGSTQNGHKASTRRSRNRAGRGFEDLQGSRLRRRSPTAEKEPCNWVREVTYDENRSTTHIGNGIQIMASLRNTTIKRHRLDGASARKIAAQLPSLLINYAVTPVSNGFRADTIT